MGISFSIFFNLRVWWEKVLMIGNETAKFARLAAVCSIQVNLPLLAVMVAICAEGTTARYLYANIGSSWKDDKHWTLFLGNSFVLLIKSKDPRQTWYRLAENIHHYSLVDGKIGTLTTTYAHLEGRSTLSSFSEPLLVGLVAFKCMFALLNLTT